MESQVSFLIRHMKTARWNMLRVMLVLALPFQHGAERMDIMNFCALLYVAWMESMTFRDGSVCHGKQEVGTVLSAQMEAMKTATENESGSARTV
jgi:hypothetical protein